MFAQPNNNAANYDFFSKPPNVLGNYYNDIMISFNPDCWHIAISEAVKVGTEQTVLYDTILLKF